MRYSGLQVVFQEIPNEVSLAIHIAGCPLRCVGCHSADLWDSKGGFELNPTVLQDLIKRHKPYISCVLFMGGEWNPADLLQCLEIVRLAGFKTALYSGFERHQIDKNIIEKLDYLKYGPYIEGRGALSSLNTNQVLINLKTKEVLNHYFTEEMRL